MTQKIEDAELDKCCVSLQAFDTFMRMDDGCHSITIMNCTLEDDGDENTDDNLMTMRDNGLVDDLFCPTPP